MFLIFIFGHLNIKSSLCCVFNKVHLKCLEVGMILSISCSFFNLVGTISYGFVRLFSLIIMYILYCMKWCACFNSTVQYFVWLLDPLLLQKALPILMEINNKVHHIKQTNLTFYKIWYFFLNNLTYNISN